MINWNLSSTRKSEARLIFIFTAVYTGFSIVAAIKSLYFLRKTGYPLSSFPYYLVLVDWLTVVSIMIYIAFNTKALLKKGWAWGKILLLHFALIVVVNTAIRLWTEMQLFSLRNDLSNITFSYLFDRLMAYIDINYLIYFVMLFIVYGYYYNKNMTLAKEREKVLENQLLSSTLKTLNSQIQPHFLFNTLNSIVYFISADKKKATDMTIDLSEYLRECLKLSNTYFIPLKEELVILKRYLNLQKTRFGKKIQITQSIALDTLSVPIPPFILQPILENSIKHGYDSELELFIIKITIRSIENNLEIIIENNGKPLKDYNGIFIKGTGLSNIYNRLKTIYGLDFKVSLNGKEDGVYTELVVPKNPPNATAKIVAN